MTISPDVIYDNYVYSVYSGGDVSNHWGADNACGIRSPANANYLHGAYGVYPDGSVYNYNGISIDWDSCGNV